MIANNVVTSPANVVTRALRGSARGNTVSLWKRAKHPAALETPSTHNFPARLANNRNKIHDKRLPTPAAIPYWISPESPEPFLAYNTAILLPWILMVWLG